MVLHQAAQEVLCRAVCSWAGVPLPELEVPRRTRAQSGFLIDNVRPWD